MQLTIAGWNTHPGLFNNPVIYDKMLEALKKIEEIPEVSYRGSFESMEKPD